MKKIPSFEEIIISMKEKECRRKQRLAMLGRKEFKRKGKKL